MIEFNPYNYDSLISLMDIYGDSKDSFFGKNENGENVIYGIYSDCVITETYQHNNWTRKNAYHRDGRMEEWFEK